MGEVLNHLLSHSNVVAVVLPQDCLDDLKDWLRQRSLWLDELIDLRDVYVVVKPEPSSDG